MIKAPIRLTKKNPFTLILFGVCFLYIFVTEFIFIFASNILFNIILIGIHTTALIVNIILMIVTLILMIFCINKDPGYLTNNDVDFQELLDIMDPTQLCADCKVIRTLRSRHCSICHRCVERFDHHCPWINNCVGINNHNYFIAYLII